MYPPQQGYEYPSPQTYWQEGAIAGYYGDDYYEDEDVVQGGGVICRNEDKVKQAVKLVFVAVMLYFVREAYRSLPSLGELGDLLNPVTMVTDPQKALRPVWNTLINIIATLIVGVVYVIFCKWVQYDGDFASALFDSVVTVPIFGHGSKIISCIFL